MPMLDKVLLALDELAKWKERQERIGHQEIVDKQVAYYTSLLREMKQEICRPGLRLFLRDVY